MKFEMCSTKMLDFKISWSPTYLLNSAIIISTSVLQLNYQPLLGLEQKILHCLKSLSYSTVRDFIVHIGYESMLIL